MSADKVTITVRFSKRRLAVGAAVVAVVALAAILYAGRWGWVFGALAGGAAQ